MKHSLSTISLSLLIIALPMTTNLFADTGAQNQIDTLLAQSISLLETESESAILIAERAVDLADSLDMLHHQANALRVLGSIQSQIGDSEDALESLRRGLAVIESVRTKEADALRLNLRQSLSTTLGILNREREAAEVIRSILDSVQADEDPKTATDAYISLATYQFLLGEYDSALENALSGLRTAETYSDTTNIIKACQAIGMIYRNLEQFPDALAFFKRAAKLARIVNDDPAYIRAINEESNILIRFSRSGEAISKKSEAIALARAIGDETGLASCSHDLAIIYTRAEMPDSALLHFIESYEAHKKLNMFREASISAGNASMMYRSLGNGEKALHWAGISFDLAEQADLPPLKELGHTRLAEAYEQLGDFRNAFYELTGAYDLRELILSEEGAIRVAELRTLYETEQHENEIEILKRDRAIQDLNLKREQTGRKLWFSGFLGIAGIGLVLLYAYRLKAQSNTRIRKTNLELEKAQKKLEELARTDPLTSLANRRCIEEHLDEELRRFERLRSPFAVIIGDIDDFKEINDEKGHECGDTVIVAISNVLKDSVRSMDSVGRWGGEEFLILLPSTDKEGASRTAEKIRSRLHSQLDSIDCLGRPVTMTFGIGIYYGGDLDHCLRRADEALYRGKRLGKDRVEYVG